MDVYLAVPVERTDSMNCRLDHDTGSRPTRYSTLVTSSKVVDDYKKERALKPSEKGPSSVH